jgi:ethanolamine utilization microcompartment shell protein EutS
MADPFSVTANVAAVIGLLDVVCRVGKEIYGFVAAVKNASKEIKELQGELQSIENILLSTRQCCKKHLDQLSTTSEDSSAISNIGSTLKRIESEYATLSAIITSTIRTKSGRRRIKPTERLTGSLTWVINGDIGRSCKKLERCKSQLSLDLSILGR